MEKFKLIDGEFTANEAKEVITNLIEFKIGFHLKQNFSNEIRSGRQDVRSLARAENLRKTKAEFLDYLEHQSDSDKFKIFAEIQINK